MHVQGKYALSLANARRLIEERGWARIVTAGPEGLHATYGYFMLDPERDDEFVVAGHFARADPQCADIEARQEVLLIFDGPSGFISASWYAPDVTRIPSTWNHISVHLHGQAEPIDGDEKFALLSRTLDHHESPEPTPWRLEGEGLETSRRIAPETVAFRLRAERVEAKAKLSQAMPLPVRQRIIEHLEGDGPHANAELAALMRRYSL
jgi:transcriptional regulator